MNSETERFSHPKTLVALWLGWIIGPTVWMLNLVISYALVPWICRTGNYFMLHLITAVALLLVVSGAYIAWRYWQRAGQERPDSAEETMARSRFLAGGGIILSALFSLVILTQGIANFILDACQ